MEIRKTEKDKETLKNRTLTFGKLLIRFLASKGADAPEWL